MHGAFRLGALGLVLSIGGGAAKVSEPTRAVPSPTAYAHAVYAPVPLFAVKLADDFWRPRIDTNIQKGWTDLQQKFESAGSIDAFRTIAEKRDAPAPRPNNDEFVYKWMEAGGFYSGYPDCGETCRRINVELRRMIDLVLSTATPEGYINTWYSNPRTATLENTPYGNAPWNPKGQYELYNFGHLAQAAISTYRATGDRRLLDAVVRFADLIVAKFGAPNHLPYTARPDHPNHEMAMVELYRVTGDRRYLRFVEHTYDEYKYWPRTAVQGHAVRDSLLNTGAVDLYLETGKPAHLETPARLWDDMVRARMYLTGGIGSHRQGEAFGEPYVLPDDGYAETCAQISAFFWSHRLLLATGDGRYGDHMERLMYNGVISGISLAGTEYFYRNPVAFRGQDDAAQRIGPRKPWFGAPGPPGTPCCPPNVSRFLASLADYFYAAKEDRLLVNLYGANSARVPVSGTVVGLTQTTRYPWDGHVRITVAPDTATAFRLLLRVPAWTQGRPVPSDLYRYLNDAPHAVKILVNGRVSHATPERGFVAVSRTWKKGDVIDLQLPMPVRRVLAHAAVSHLQGQVAFERGPIVYAFEGIDNGGHALDVAVEDAATLSAEARPALLGGITVLTGPGLAVDGTGRERRLTVTAIPYALWNNRGAGDMTVWLARDRASLRRQAVLPAPAH
jgi:DUF1680 family protein